MTINNRLTVWTIIFHAIVLIGMGHGIACFLLFEILWLYTFFSAVFHWDFTSTLLSSQLSVFCLVSLLGEVATLLSLFNKKRRTLLYIAGLVLYWTGIFLFIKITESDSYTHIAGIMLLPLAICTIICFPGIPLKKFLYWFLDKDFPEKE